MRTAYYNGQVYVDQATMAEAFLVEDGRFSLVGGSGEVLARPHDRAVDLRGAFVCPGFIDSHMHLLSYGNTLLCPRLDQHTGSLEEMLRCLRDFERTYPRGPETWLMGRGWNQDYFADERRMPDRFDLDKVSERVPVCATRACGHCLAVNSRALELLGIDKDTPEVEGGQIGRLPDGRPNGLFFDNAMDLVYASVPPAGKEEIKAMILAACKALNASGITGVQSDDYCVNRAIPWQTINEAYRELEAAGQLTVRVYEQSNFTDVESLAAFVEAGNRTGAGTDLFQIGPLKMLGDGALGARTAYLSRPYADDPETRGIPVFPQKTFDEMIAYANDHNMQVAVHCIGDACLDSVLDAMEKALKRHPRADHRHGIVHCQITRPDQLRRIADLGLHVYYQGIFLDYDSRIVPQRVGEELARTSYSWKALADMGVSCSNGTDCPVERPDPLFSLQCAVTRQSLDGAASLLPEQAFSVAEALDGYTIRSAEASFEEDCKGRIKAGMLADFAVLGENLLEAEPESIHSISVLAVYLGGSCVYQA